MPKQPAAEFYPAERAEFCHSRLNLSRFDIPFKPISAFWPTDTQPLPLGKPPFESKGGFL
jgi:hypothetical protein